VARFFQNGSSIDLIEVEELLLRYPNYDYIMNLEINEGILIINKAIEKRTEDRHFSMWTSLLPFMTEDTYISFEDYRVKLTGGNISRISREEALAKAEEIEMKVKRKGGM
jgi:hypothetical protein